VIFHPNLLLHAWQVVAHTCVELEDGSLIRLTALSAKGDPLEAIDRLVPWESLRSDIEAAVLTPETERKSTAGRKPIDAIVLFRMLILQSLYNLSDEQVEYQVRDRLSFSHSMREKTACAALNRTQVHTVEPRRRQISCQLLADPHRLTITQQKRYCSRCPLECS
jgi:hypothetical protein